MTGNIGRFFEDYQIGEEISHAIPRTLAEADNSIYMSIYPSRFAINSSREFAKACGLKDRPLDDLIIFHTVFGKTVPDISLNGALIVYINNGVNLSIFISKILPKYLLYIFLLKLLLLDL